MWRKRVSVAGGWRGEGGVGEEVRVWGEGEVRGGEAPVGWAVGGSGVRASAPRVGAPVRTMKAEQSAVKARKVGHAGWGGEIEKRKTRKRNDRGVRA